MGAEGQCLEDSIHSPAFASPPLLSSSVIEKHVPGSLVLLALADSGHIQESPSARTDASPNTADNAQAIAHKQTLHGFMRVYCCILLPFTYTHLLKTSRASERSGDVGSLHPVRSQLTQKSPHRLPRDAPLGLFLCFSNFEVLKPYSENSTL